MIKKLNLIFVTFFYIGKIKFAPGTFASLFTCIFFLLLMKIFNIMIIAYFTLIIFLYSFLAINNISESFKSDDPHEIVVDEVVGQMLPLLFIPIYENLYLISNEYYCIISFLLFRFFDIWKPFPVNFIDKNVKGALGIMLDDVMAGIYVIITLTLIFFFIGG